MKVHNPAYNKPCLPCFSTISTKRIASMLSLRRISSMFVAAAVLTIFMTPSLANAQSGTPAATCDSTFGADAGTVFQNVSAAMNSGSAKAADYAQMAVDLAKIRAEYEDMTTPPAGCEATRLGLAQISALDVDTVMLNLMALLDNTNASTYSDFSKTVWQPRLEAFKARMAATAPAVTPDASASAATVCADAGYQAQIPADFKAMPTPDMTNAASIGTGLLAILKTRYQYEDATAPAGCELARQDMIKLLGAGEDVLIVGAGALADTAHASTYTDFLNNNVQARGQKLGTTLKTDLGAPSAATPAATDAS
jgi:hypothetical protein